MPEVHSTGRGGAGNIGKDEATYTDANIVREGIAGESNRAEYSSGRGGAGNMVNSPAPPANSTGAFQAPPPGSEEVVPEPATREHRPGEDYADFHTGRGGGGNVHREKYGGHSKPQKEAGEKKEGLGEKIKEKIGLGH
ncbi:hypothetical protein MBLNU230_g4733t1 [Neophaeotheca triangularis]